MSIHTDFPSDTSAAWTESPQSAARVEWNHIYYLNWNRSASHFTQKAFAFRTVLGSLTWAARAAPFLTLWCAGQRVFPFGYRIIHSRLSVPASRNF